MEGDGRCGHCEREGLRWVVFLSDGKVWGSSCAKKALGINVGPLKAHAWTASFSPVATRVDCGDVHVLWAHPTAAQTRETVNGHLQLVGGARQEWEKRGWI